MDRTACRRFVLPTPRSRWPIHDFLRRMNASRKSGVAGTIPFNNAAERGLRCVALGRKSGCSRIRRGGRRAAAMYTLIVTAKMNDVDPQAWLADVLAKLPDHPAHRLAEMMPWAWKARQEAAARVTTALAA